MIKSQIKDKLGVSLLKNKQWFILIAFFALSFNVNAREYSDTVFYTLVKNAVELGDVEQLSKVINGKVELILPSTSGIYSSNQAKYILQDFFRLNQAKSFIFISKRESKNDGYYVGKLHTNKKHFRVCFLTKTTNNKIFIYQIRIEE